MHYGGRQFIATYQMAGIFLRRAQRLLDAEDAELVPLLHEGGLELLYVSSAMPFSVHDADAEPADGSHPNLAIHATVPAMSMSATSTTATSTTATSTGASHSEAASHSEVA